MCRIVLVWCLLIGLFGSFVSWNASAFNRALPYFYYCFLVDLIKSFCGSAYWDTPLEYSTKIQCPGIWFLLQHNKQHMIYGQMIHLQPTNCQLLRIPSVAASLYTVCRNTSILQHGQYKLILQLSTIITARIIAKAGNATIAILKRLV